MQSLEDAAKLAGTMVSIGHKVGRQVVALITDMNVPLGHNIGNSLEVAEAVETLQGRGPADLELVCLELAANMLLLAGLGEGDPEACRQAARETIKDGRAFAKFKAMTRAQGGDVRYLEDPGLFPAAPVIYPVQAPADGYISGMDALAIGKISVDLGAGRLKKGEPVDYRAGLVLQKKIGEKVNKGQIIAQLHTASAAAALDSAGRFLQAVTFSQEKPAPKPLIHARVTSKGVTYFH